MPGIPAVQVVAFLFVISWLWRCGLKEFRISRKNSLFMAVIAAVTILGVVAIGWININPGNVQPTTEPDQAQITSAVTAGIEAFFHIDYREGKEAWIERICLVSTENGCQYFRSGVDPLWKRFEDFQIVTEGNVEQLDSVSETETEQVWRVKISLTQPLPGSEKTSDEAYVLVMRTENGWMFERFLMEKEIQALAQKSTQAQPKGSSK